VEIFEKMAFVESTLASAQRQAYLFLRAEIQSGRLPGGTHIKPEDVALQLGISRMPVREAIRQLDAEGMLTIRPNRGAVVTILTPDHLNELFEARAVLEALCARHAATRLHDDARDELMMLLDRLNRNGNKIDLWIARHEAFHDFICLCADRPYLAAEARRLRAAVEPYLRMSQTHQVTMGDSARQHSDLVKVLLARDPERAEQAMRLHVESTAAEFIPALASAP
jgi:DNA-binding GntR family transcriptional regulator